MLQSGALAAEDIRWLWGLGNVWETVIVCSISSKALAPASSQQYAISFARPLMFIPRDQQQNPGCQEEMK
jgi:hypothetical protein